MTPMLIAIVGWITASLPVDTIVVCPPEFRPALRPWVELRQQQGRVIAYVDNQGTAVEIRGEIRELAGRHPIRWILLVGDATPDDWSDPVQVARTTPTHFQLAQIISRWGPDRTIATDNPYADLSGDGLPELAVGRLTADTPAELSIMVEKILAYEKARPEGNWRQQLNFVAGVGGFGGIVDSVLEYTTKRFLTEGIPAAYRTTMTYGSWRSPFFPDPRRFHEVAVDRLNEGCLFWVYLGHGQRQHLDRVQVPGGTFHILGTQDMPKLQPAEVPAIAMFLACYTAAFDEPEDCLAEELLRAPGGPVAVLGGSRVTMPYAMAVMGSAMLHEYFHEERVTLGELVMQAKRSLGALPTGDGLAEQDEAGRRDPIAERSRVQRQMLDALAAALSPHRNRLADERMEHVALFNLLGDPLLSLSRPVPIHFELDERAAAGSRLEVTVSSSITGQGTLELVSRRDQQKHSLPARRQFSREEASLARMHDDYLLANDLSWFTTQVDLTGEPARLAIDIPAEVRGPCYLRCYIAGEATDALGAAPVFIYSP
jgi:hypothetical protein